MKKSLLFIALSLITGDLMSKRPEGMVVIGTGWCTDYQAPVLDWLTRRANFVVQTKASLNKPREIIINGVMYRFYHIPVSILQAPHIKVYMAPGTLLDLELLIKEIKTLEKLGIDTKKRIRISASAQILMPYEKRIGANSRKTNNCNMGGGVPVGTGAANADKCMGIAFRVADLMSVDYKNILKISVDRGNNTLVKLYEDAPIDEKQVLKEYTKYREFLKPYVRDGIELKFNQMLSHGKAGLFISPYATYLDSTHGTYPCTAGVSALASSICASAGIGFKRVKSFIGVVDAYSIHPGNGRMITKIIEPEVVAKVKKSLGSHYKSEHAYGWPDLVMIRQAVMINGLDCIVFNGLNFLDDLDEIKMCIDYDLDGRHLDYPAPTIADLKRVVPHYLTFPGWKTSTKDARVFTDLPQEARTFLKQLECLAGVPIALITVGDTPEDMVIVSDHFFPHNIFT